MGKHIPLHRKLILGPSIFKGQGPTTSHVKRWSMRAQRDKSLRKLPGCQGKRVFNLCFYINTKLVGKKKSHHSLSFVLPYRWNTSPFTGLVAVVAPSHLVKTNHQRDCTARWFPQISGYSSTCRGRNLPFLGKIVRKDLLAEHFRTKPEHLWRFSEMVAKLPKKKICSESVLMRHD